MRVSNLLPEHRILSPPLTLSLAVLLVAYLAAGKLQVIPLQATYMVVLAALTILHGAGTIVSQVLVSRGPDGEVRVAIVLNIAMLAGLLVFLSLGLLNYLLGFHGYLDVIPGGEPMRLGSNVQIVQKGALSRPERYDQRVEAAEFTRNAAGNPALRLNIRSGSTVDSFLLEQGARHFHDGLWLKYQGMRYRVALVVQRGRHDYLAAPVTLVPVESIGHYAASLDVVEPGVQGEVTLDSSTGKLRAVVMRNGVVEFDGEIQPGRVAVKGEMRVQVLATSHFGTVLVQNRNYRWQTLLAMVFFLVGGTGRVLHGMGARRKGDQRFPDCH